MNNLMWFRNDLRVADNRSLTEACQGDKLIAVYFFDPRYYAEGDFGFKKTEKYRARFLIQTISELRAELEKLNISLLVFHERPEDKLPDLVKEHSIQNIYLQKEWT
ncbi:MAG: deoxyribodipyrimidine photo-lyase, partial [Pricia sp.]